MYCRSISFQEYHTLPKWNILCYCKCSLFVNIGLLGAQHPLKLKYFFVIVACILVKNIVALTFWYVEGVVVLKAQYKVKSSDTAIVVISVEAGPQKGEEEKRNGSASVEEESKSQRCQKVLQGELYFGRGPEGEETQTEVSKEGNHITWNSPAVRIFPPWAPPSWLPRQRIFPVICLLTVAGLRLCSWVIWFWDLSIFGRPSHFWHSW